MIFTNKKAIAPIIATVLLIGIVVAASGASFVWFKSMTKESVMKFEQNIELTCNDVRFDASLVTGGVRVTNTGNVPIHQFSVQSIGDGNHNSEVIDTPLNVGASEDLTGLEGTKFLVIPILLGEGESGQKTYTCDDRFGVSVE